MSFVVDFLTKQPFVEDFGNSTKNHQMLKKLDECMSRVFLFNLYLNISCVINP